ncbi:MAG: aldehyde dehydrogenase EutE [Calditrichaeota bacterium]|nr:MAG: aldehyde dehydrogenase EutE [Calditrichota bacterium]MBL1205742.1 aldehyde dehydrogenase EutE [Calditrichota bacterium]NOG45570.1 aldehyde dehydrogenase EutE [Calditrichota bacterium]
MSLSSNEIKNIVDKVVTHLESDEKVSASKNALGIFDTLDEAYSAARESQKALKTLAMRSKAVEAIRLSVKKHAKELAELAVAETGMGRVEDKIQKKIIQAEKTPGVEDLQPVAVTGDNGLTLIELAAWGVIASVTPSTNPGATVINNAISMIAAGNAVIFAVHPSAKKVSQRTITLLNEAIVSVGGPEALLTTVAEPTIETAQQLFSYPGIDLLVVTGGGAVVEAARKVTDKRLMAAGPGNPPVIVDETADIARAGKGIVNGASFDNNIMCTCEKEIIAVDTIADQLKAEMINNDAYELSVEQSKQIEDVVLVTLDDGRKVVNRDWIGKDAHLIAEQIGLKLPKETRLLFAETEKNHPFATKELMMPVLPFIRVADADTAIDVAVELEKGNRHTAIMYSKNLDNLDRMANEINCSIFVKNGPCYAGLGFGGEGWTSMTITTPTGEGVTSARTFVRLRRCVLVDNFRIV